MATLNKHHILKKRKIKDCECTNVLKVEKIHTNKTLENYKFSSATYEIR
jgi:hypothetical protein